MPRRKTVTEYVNVIRRLKKEQSIRGIQRETGIHRTILRKIKKVAVKKGWLNQFSLPSENEIYEAFFVKNEPQRHPLEDWYDDIKRWIDEGYSYVVIHKLLNKQYDCSESTVRRFIRKRFPKMPKTSMVRETTPGEIMEVDFGYLGITYDFDTKKNRKTYVFSARLRHSRKAYRQKVFNQDQKTFFKCHIYAFEYFGGVPEKVVPDNLKAAVIKASFHDPVINRVYQKLAEHYGFIISPCLPWKANHKGGVENDIKYIKNNFWPIFKEEQKEKGREIPYACDIDKELGKWAINVTDTRKIQGVGKSPNQIFNDEEQKELKSLPLFRWDEVDWAEVVVRENWRIQYDYAFYTVPYQYVGKKVQILADSSFAHIFLNYLEIATHMRAKYKWQHVKKAEHAPPESEKYMSTTKKGLLNKARYIGCNTEKVIEEILQHKSVDGFRPARGILFGLSKKYGNVRLEKACKRALYYQTINYMSVKSILKNSLDELELEEEVISKKQLEFTFSREYGYFNPQNIKKQEESDG